MRTRALMLALMALGLALFLAAVALAGRVH